MTRGAVTRGAVTRGVNRKRSGRWGSNRPWLRRLALFALALLASACQGLFSCSGDDVLARLSVKDGSITRDFADSQKQWQDAELGSEFRVGDAVRSDPDSAAILDLKNGAKLKLQKDTVVRFSAARPGSGEQGLNVETGEATLESSAEQLFLRTQFGVAAIEGNSTVRLTSKGDKNYLEVLVGQASVENADGELVEVKQGEALDIGVGLAVVEQEPVDQVIDLEPVDVSIDLGSIDITVTGTVAAQQAGDDEWQDIGPGANKVESGTIMKVPGNSSVTVQSEGQQATVSGPGMFVIGSTGGVLVEAFSGTTEVQSGSSDVAVAVPNGVVKAHGGGSATRITVGKDATTIVATVGTTAVQVGDIDEVLNAGESMSIKADGSMKLIGRGPRYLDFRVRAGASFAVHDPTPPTVVGFDISICPIGGVVERLERGKVAGASRGDGVANVEFPPGRSAYQVRCLGANGPEPQAASRGNVSILHDPGTAQIPFTSPLTQINTDGRAYNVLYQNLLPRIQVRWRRAPKAEKYRLEVSGGSPKSLTSRIPGFDFRAGELGEGTHKLTVTALSEAPSQSLATTVNILFDNAARTASISSPADRAFEHGATVQVSGIALQGWKVNAGGTELQLDEQLRFNGSAVAPSFERALAIRLSHPKRGVQYYLRRVASE